MGTSERSGEDTQPPSSAAQLQASRCAVCGVATIGRDEEIVVAKKVREVDIAFDAGFYTGVRKSITYERVSRESVAVCTDCVKRRESLYVMGAIVFAIITLITVIGLLPTNNRFNYPFMFYVLGAVLAFGGCFLALFFGSRRLGLLGDGIDVELAIRAVRSKKSGSSYEEGSDMKLFSLSQWVLLKNNTRIEDPHDEDFAMANILILALILPILFGVLITQL